jgi:hypothetical protein
MGLFRIIVDTSGPQTVVGPFGLMLNGLCFNMNEQWAPSFSPVVTGWTQAFAVPTTTWSGITLPSTTWTSI